MAFWNREKIMPEVAQPYGPYQDLTSQLNQSYDTAQNRSAQKINQIYGSAGMNPRGAPASAAKARSATDIENQRAQQSYQSYYDWLRGKQMVNPQILPSGASTAVSPFVAGIGTAAGPGIVNAATKGLGNAWDYMTGASAIPSSPGYGFGGWDTGGGYADVMPPAYADVPDFSSAYSAMDVPSVWDNVNPADLFDTGFIGF